MFLLLGYALGVVCGVMGLRGVVGWMHEGVEMRKLFCFSLPDLGVFMVAYCRMTMLRMLADT